MRQIEQFAIDEDLEPTGGGYTYFSKLVEVERVCNCLIRECTKNKPDLPEFDPKHRGPFPLEILFN